MTARKPVGASWQSWIDQQIEHGRARGDFDGLPGHGKPIAGLERPRDEMWWVRDKLRREGVEYLPPSLAIRKSAGEAKQRALAAPSEPAARSILEEINEAIRQLNRCNVEGPPTTLMPFDIEEVLADRRARVVDAATTPPPSPCPPDVTGHRPRRPSFWARLRARVRRDEVAGDGGPHHTP